MWNCQQIPPFKRQVAENRKIFFVVTQKNHNFVSDSATSSGKRRASLQEIKETEKDKTSP